MQSFFVHAQATSVIQKRAWTNQAWTQNSWHIWMTHWNAPLKVDASNYCSSAVWAEMHLSPVHTKKKKKRKRDLNLFKFKFEFKAFKIPHLLLVTYCKTWIQIWIERDFFFFFFLSVEDKVPSFLVPELYWPEYIPKCLLVQIKVVRVECG